MCNKFTKIDRLFRNFPTHEKLSSPFFLLNSLNSDSFENWINIFPLQPPLALVYTDWVVKRKNSLRVSRSHSLDCLSLTIHTREGWW